MKERTVYLKRASNGERVSRSRKCRLMIFKPEQFDLVLSGEGATTEACESGIRLVEGNAARTSRGESLLG